jgi:DNA-binding transcriptional LysR family regulator
MDTIRAMRYFVRAVELGSLSAVAREDGTGQSHVSKVLRALEQTLGVRLFERSTTGLAPTEQGLRFHARARLVLEEFEQAVADAQGATKQPAGLLRINAPVAFGQLRMNAIVQQFLIDFPQVQIELILDDRFVDLVEEGVDVALRLGSVLPPTAVARPLGTSVRVLVAAPAYVQRHGTKRAGGAGATRLCALCLGPAGRPGDTDVRRTHGNGDHARAVSRQPCHRHSRQPGRRRRYWTVSCLAGR